jgi:hypothetical protein
MTAEIGGDHLGFRTTAFQALRLSTTHELACGGGGLDHEFGQQFSNVHL